MHLLLSCVIVCCLQVVTVKAKNFSVVLVGGHLADDNEEIWGRIVELGGGKGRARFGVITAASEDPCCDEDSSWIYYRDLLTNYGAEEVNFVLKLTDVLLISTNNCLTFSCLSSKTSLT